MQTEEVMAMRPAWFVWAHGNKGPQPRIIFQEANPVSDRGPDDRAYGPVYLAAHELTGEVLQAVNDSDGGCSWSKLAEMFPAPKVEDET